VDYYCFIKLRKKNYIIVDLIVGVTGLVCYFAHCIYTYVCAKYVLFHSSYI